jgi:hypothetical protein
MSWRPGYLQLAQEEEVQPEQPELPAALFVTRPDLSFV